jgi:integrase
MASSRGGISERHRAKGKVFQARFRDHDSREHCRTFRTKGDAQAWLNDSLAKMQRGEWTNPLAVKTTLAEWAEQWLAIPGKRPTTAARDRNVLETHWIPALGRRRLPTIRPADVHAVVKKMSERLAPKTITTNYGVFRACINAAVEADLIGRSPCRGVNLPKVGSHDTGEIRFLERDELDRLAAAVPEEYRAMMYVAGVLGLRWSEAVGLRVGRIDFLKRTLSVVETIAEVHGELIRASVKTKASRRTLAVPGFLVDMLAEHLACTGRRDPEALVFQAPEGGPLRATNFRRRVWAPAVNVAHVEGLTFHGLRHTAVGFMIALGYQPAVIQKRMGHASIRTTLDVYGHLLPSADEAVADGLEQFFTAPVSSCAATA